MTLGGLAVELAIQTSIEELPGNNLDKETVNGLRSLRYLE